MILINLLKSLFYLIPRSQKSGKGNKTILVINHYFDQDLQALKNANNRFTIVVLKPEIFQPIRDLYPKEVKKGTTKYLHPKYRKHRKLSRAFSKIVFKLLVYHFGRFVAVISPSDIFYWYREFVHIANKKGIYTVVIDKEGTISPNSFKNHSIRIKNQFPLISKEIIVWSNRQKEFWIRAGTESNKIKVIGQPRSDILINSLSQKNKVSGSNSILFFTYAENAYVPPEEYLKNKVSWKKLRKETHEVIFNCARLFPDVSFTVKCHPQQSDFAIIKNYFQNLKNITVMNDPGSSNKLLLRSDLVIGFQTTALIEAVLLNKPVAYTFWTSDTQRIIESLLPFHKFDVFNKITSAKHLKNFISNSISEGFKFSSNPASRSELVSLYLNRPDGRVSERIFNHLAEVLKTR